MLEIDGRAWSISEATTPLLAAFQKSKEPAGFFLNELVTQLEYPNRKFLLLTNLGLTTVVKQRPIDLFLQVLTSKSLLKDFMAGFGLDQICAMCLVVACGHICVSTGPAGVTKNNQIAASQLFHELGGAPSVNQNIPNQMGRRAGVVGVLRTTTEIQYSPKHSGLALYLARLLRPIWKKQIFKSDISVDDFVLVQANLKSLDTLLNQFPNFTAPPSAETRPLNVDPEAWKTEQQSLADIHSLIRRSIESIHLITLLLDFKMENIPYPTNLPDITQLTYETFVISEHGRDIAKGLMSGLVNCYIEKDDSVESIIETLKMNCPTICENNDTIVFKVKPRFNNGRAQNYLKMLLKPQVHINKPYFTKHSKHFQRLFRLFHSISL